MYVSFSQSVHLCPFPRLKDRGKVVRSHQCLHPDSLFHDGLLVGSEFHPGKIWNGPMKNRSSTMTMTIGSSIQTFAKCWLKLVEAPAPAPTKSLPLTTRWAWRRPSYASPDQAVETINATNPVVQPCKASWNPPWQSTTATTSAVLGLSWPWRHESTVDREIPITGTCNLVYLFRHHVPKDFIDLPESPKVLVGSLNSNNFKLLYPGTNSKSCPSSHPTWSFMQHPHSPTRLSDSSKKVNTMMVAVHWKGSSAHATSATNVTEGTAPMKFNNISAMVNGVPPSNAKVVPISTRKKSSGAWQLLTPTSLCKLCRRKFFGAEYYNCHLQLGSLNIKSISDIYKKCSVCCHVYELSSQIQRGVSWRRPEHMCGQQVHLATRRCFIQSIPEDEDEPKMKRVPGEEAGTRPFLEPDPGDADTSVWV